MPRGTVQSEVIRIAYASTVNLEGHVWEARFPKLSVKNKTKKGNIGNNLLLKVCCIIQVI